LRKTTEALAAEAERLAEHAAANQIQWDVKTLYWGGGTPSVLPLDLMIGLVRRLESSLDFRAGELQESTIEANPENISAESLAAWNEAGFGRLSVGIQTFSSERLALLGRWCDHEKNHRALATIAADWAGAWNGDLMTGLPGQGNLKPQTWIELRRDLDTLLSYQPNHVSLYSLIVEPETDFADMLRGGSLSVCPDAVADQLWVRARDTLIERGFEWYEISNFARAGARSIHNQTYWNLDAWAGLGPGAEGTLPVRDSAGRLVPLRTRNPKLFPWLTGQRTHERLTAEEFATEHFVSGWRTADGLRPGRLRRLFGKHLDFPPDRLSDTDRLFLNQHLATLPEFSEWSFEGSWPEASSEA